MVMAFGRGALRGIAHGILPWRISVEPGLQRHGANPNRQHP